MEQAPYRAKDVLRRAVSGDLFQSTRPFDAWLRDQRVRIHGLDPSVPPPPPQLWVDA